MYKLNIDFVTKHLLYSCRKHIHYLFMKKLHLNRHHTDLNTLTVYANTDTTLWLYRILKTRPICINQHR